MGIQVLIIDTNASLVRVIKNAIVSFHEDFQVKTAATEDQAIHILGKTKFNLILCESHFIDSRSTLAPIIMLSAPHVPIVLTDQGLSSGYNEGTISKSVKSFLTTPLNLTDLAAKVVMALEDIFYQGILQGIRFASFLQILDQDYEDCLLKIINSKKSSEGFVFYKDGQAIDAKYGYLEARDAVNEILRWENCDIKIYSICPLTKNKINLTSTALILKNRTNQKESDHSHRQIPNNESPKPQKKHVKGLAGIYLKKRK